jgi:predicted lipoprotein with Yx(FWY)xxD motif
MRGRGIRLALAVALMAAAGTGAAMAMTASTHSRSGTVNVVRNSRFGMILVSSSGRTLYRYTPDKKDVSVCKGACLKVWPPLLVKATARPTVGSGANAKLLGTIKAAHGKRQVTYGGFPLYFFAQDTKAGQINGQGFGGKWYLVSTKGALIKHPAKTPAAPPATTTSSSSGWG